MLIAEYDYDVDIAVQREEEREIALKEGIAQGKQEGISEGSYLSLIHISEPTRP